jgi:hypothetical protein
MGATAGDSRLPDGTSYAAWEQPFTFSKTYYVDASAAAADDSGPVTQARPSRTISKAAQVLRPGDRVVIAARRATCSARTPDTLERQARWPTQARSGNGRSTLAQLGRDRADFPNYDCSMR